MIKRSKLNKMSKNEMKCCTALANKDYEVICRTLYFLSNL
jgi:hypothetical protein